MSADRDSWQDDRPVLPSIRSLFGGEHFQCFSTQSSNSSSEELSRSPRPRMPTDPPSSPLARMSFRDDDPSRYDDRRSRMMSRVPGEPQVCFFMFDDGSIAKTEIYFCSFFFLQSRIPGSASPSPYSNFMHTPTPSYPHTMVPSPLTPHRHPGHPRFQYVGGQGTPDQVPPQLAYPHRATFDPRVQQFHHPSGAVGVPRHPVTGAAWHDSRGSSYPVDRRNLPGRLPTSDAGAHHSYGYDVGRSHSPHLAAASIPTTASLYNPSGGLSEEERARYQPRTVMVAGIPEQTESSGVSMGGNFSSGSKYECTYCGKGFTRPSSLKVSSYHHFLETRTNQIQLDTCQQPHWRET